MLGGLEIVTAENALVIDVVDFHGDPDKINKAYADSERLITCNYGYLREDCEAFNAGLISHILSEIKSRKQKLLGTKKKLESRGVPLRKKTEVAETFSVPAPILRKKIKLAKPEVSVEKIQPEPILDDKSYHQILKLINDVGKNFERMPSVYSNKKEEDLRDHILMILDPNFQMGSATGETFNKKGKTDIQLRFDSSVVFIAECKFWSGKVGFHKTIDQLLGYLTWRDSKSAIVIFVQNKDFTKVLDEIKNSAENHPNFIKFDDMKDESWYNFTFHLVGDEERHLNLAVLAFHLPIELK